MKYLTTTEKKLKVIAINISLGRPILFCKKATLLSVNAKIKYTEANNTKRKLDVLLYPLQIIKTNPPINNIVTPCWRLAEAKVTNIMN
jgi:hypothetical protein